MKVYDISGQHPGPNKGSLVFTLWSTSQVNGGWFKV